MGKTNEDKRRELDALPEVPGDWAVDHSVCTGCAAPPVVAPSLMGFGVNHSDPRYSQCYFRRQPSSPAEHDLAFEAAAVSCCAAVRYHGHDAALLERMRCLDESRWESVVIERALRHRRKAGRLLIGALLLLGTTLAWMYFRR